jgi:peptidoglycan/LPS O-acetylase OafA/YrhL
LMAVLCLPKGWLGPWAELAAVTVLFPAIVVLGANHLTQGLAARASRVLGDLSYPVYVLQVPVMWIAGGALKAAHLYDRVPLVWVGIALMMVIAVISWAALKLVDEPVRRYLTGLTRKKLVTQQ